MNDHAMPRRARRGAVVLLAMAGMLATTMVGSATALDDTPHPHVMFLHAQWEGEGPGTILHSYERCIQLANGRALPLQSHHQTVHRGTAGGALAQRAGHLVAPAPACP